MMDWSKSLCIGCIFLLACESKDGPDFTPNEKILYDSLHKQEFANIRVETDSICKILEDSLYNFYVDSIIEIRLQEVEYLIKDIDEANK